MSPELKAWDFGRFALENGGAGGQRGAERHPVKKGCLGVKAWALKLQGAGQDI